MLISKYVYEDYKIICLIYIYIFLIYKIHDFCNYVLIYLFIVDKV